MHVSTNELAKVKLTVRGADILNYYNHDAPLVQAGESFETSLWNLMAIFGKHFEWGLDSPFENNEIIF